MDILGEARLRAMLKSYRSECHSLRVQVDALASDAKDKVQEATFLRKAASAQCAKLAAASSEVEILKDELRVARMDFQDVEGVQVPMLEKQIDREQRQRRRDLALFREEQRQYKAAQRVAEARAQSAEALLSDLRAKHSALLDVIKTHGSARLRRFLQQCGMCDTPADARVK
jgi:hypothetical protein